MERPEGIDLTDQFKDWHDQLRVIKDQLERELRSRANDVSSCVGILNYHVKKSDDGFGNVEIPREDLQALIERLSKAADPMEYLEVDYFKAIKEVAKKFNIPSSYLQTPHTHGESKA